MFYAYIIRSMINGIIQKASEGGQELRNPSIWKEARNALIPKYLIHLANDELFKIILRLSQLFVNKDCQDKDVITHVLNLARQTKVQRYPWSNSYFMKTRFYGIIRKSYLEERIRSHESDDFMKIFSVPYKEAHVFFATEDAVTYSAVAGDIALLELLLTFGATMIQPSEDYSLWMYCESVVRWLFSNIPEKYIETSLRANFCKTSERRLFLVLLCLEVLIHLKSPTLGSYNYTASLRLLFKAIPEPLVTTKEISSCLEKLLRGLQKEDEIQTVVSEFGNFFPESLHIPGPRSLMQLGRFQVRENLRTSAFAFRLPQAVESLPLPKVVKKYVLFTDEDLKSSFSYPNLC